MTVRRLFASLLLLALLAMALRATIDPDMWWHLRTGELILEEGIPTQDVFSFTVTGRPWVTHEWLSQAFMWLVYLAGGLPALLLVFACVAAAAHWLVYRASDGRPYVAGFVTLLGALASSVVWGARPQMFNLLFTAVMVFALEGWRRKRWSDRALWLLVPLVIVWANFHSGYLFGVALLATVFVGEVGRRWLLRDDRALSVRQIRTLVLVTAACFFTAALSPNGVRLWFYPFETLGSNAMQTYIQEWHSPNFHVPIFWAFGALLAMGLAGFVLSEEPITPTDLLLFLGTGAAGLQSARNIPLFAIVATPILARHWSTFFAGQPGLAGLVRPEARRAPAAGAKILNWLLVAAAALGVALWANQKVATNDAAIAVSYPVAAVDFLEAEGLTRARIFNSYGWGGYLIWRGLPVFVDGRADVYGDEFLHSYVQASDLTLDWRVPLDRYAVELVLVEEDAPLSALLSAAGGWRAVYADDVARIFAREEP